MLVFQLPEHFSVLIKIFFQHAPVLSGEVIEGTVAVPIVSRRIIGVARHDECVETGEADIFPIKMIALVVCEIDKGIRDFSKLEVNLLIAKRSFVVTHIRSLYPRP